MVGNVNGFTPDETVGLESDGAPAPGQDPATMARDYLASLPRERFPNLLELADYFAVDDPDARFELLLDLILDGLARRATDRGGD